MPSLVKRGSKAPRPKTAKEMSRDASKRAGKGTPLNKKFGKK